VCYPPQAKESQNREATGNSGDREVEKLTARVEKQTGIRGKALTDSSELNVDAW